MTFAWKNWLFETKLCASKACYVEIKEEPKNSGEVFYYSNKGEVICFPAIVEPGLVLNNTIIEEVYTEDFDMKSGYTLGLIIVLPTKFAMKNHCLFEELDPSPI